jgi:MoaA/NifB/PqqE/SkfB family radical SAM enzyme
LDQGPKRRQKAGGTRKKSGVLPHGTLRSRTVVGRHILKKAAWRARTQRSAWRVARGILVESLLFELGRRNFGRHTLVQAGGGFFPHVMMPDYHSPHFEDAVRRLALPGLGPNVMYFSITGRCPYACNYCFAGAGARAPDVGDDLALEVARKVADLEVPLVNISGGEPLTRYPRLLQVVRTLKRGSEVRLFTTGVGLSTRKVDELSEAGLRGVFISLDSEDASAFDRVRGRSGAFEAAVNGLRLFSRSGVLSVVNCVVDKTSFPTADHVARFLHFVERIDPYVVVNFLPLMATGRGAQPNAFYKPSECEAVAERIVDTAGKMNRPIAMLFGRVDTLLGCPGAGGKLLNVDIEGNVTVCISKAALGNVLEEDFSVLYTRFVQKCQELKIGFFCGDVSASTNGEMAVSTQSDELLHTFYEAHEDSTWQKVLRHLEKPLRLAAIK